MSANAALADIKARVEGHTEGPLVVDDEEQTVRVGYAGEIMFDKSTEGRSYWARECRPNAELIAAAPKMLAALEAVEALHYAREDTEDLFSADCGEGLCSHAGRDDECPTVTIAPCVECSIPGVYYIAYPCPTLTAITDALA